ncbi:MAG: adenylate kinase [Candidatus Brocadiia bacterium]
MNLVFLGPPGAGKGTQAKGEAQRLGLLYIATGDELRRAIAQGTPLGEQARSYTDSGQLVPDGLIIDLVRRILEEARHARGVVFDGFPRTVGQAEALQNLLAERGESIDAVLYFDASEEAVLDRLTGRRVCRQCGATYHVRHLPPRSQGVCDQCGGELYQREDDRPQTVRERLRVYRGQTGELLDYYRQRGLLVRIDADGGIEEVRREVQAAIRPAAEGGEAAQGRS